MTTSSTRGHAWLEALNHHRHDDDDDADGTLTRRRSIPSRPDSIRGRLRRCGGDDGCEGSTEDCWRGGRMGWSRGSSPALDLYRQHVGLDIGLTMWDTSYGNRGTSAHAISREDHRNSPQLRTRFSSPRHFLRVPHDDPVSLLTGLRSIPSRPSSLRERLHQGWKTHGGEASEDGRRMV